MLARLAKGGPLLFKDMFYAYILLSLKDNRTYVGHTNNLEKRVVRHNSGFVISTKNRRPFKLLYSEKLLTLKDAKKRETWWKSGAGRNKLKEYFIKGFPIIN